MLSFLDTATEVLLSHMEEHHLRRGAHSSRSTLSGHGKFNELSKTTAMEELFTLSNASHANRNISPGC